MSMNIDTQVSADTSSAIDEWTEPAQRHPLPTKRETELTLKLAQLESDYAELVKKLERIQATHVKIEPIAPAELKVGDELLIPVKIDHIGEAPFARKFYVAFNSGFRMSVEREDFLNAIRIVGGNHEAH